MGVFSVSARGLPSVEVTAPNWIAALGEGIEAMGRSQGIERMACERLPNGTVIARDVSSGMGFVVQPTESAPEEEDLPSVEPVPLDAFDEFLLELEATPESHSATHMALLGIMKLCLAESGAVLLHQEDYLRFVAVAGPHSARLMGVRLPEGTGVAGFSLRTGRPVLLSDASRDDRHCGHVDALTGYHTKALIAAPVRTDTEVMGVVEIMNPLHRKTFGREDLQRLTIVGQLLGQRLAALRGPGSSPR